MTQGTHNKKGTTMRYLFLAALVACLVVSAAAASVVSYSGQSKSGHAFRAYVTADGSGSSLTVTATFNAKKERSYSLSVFRPDGQIACIVDDVYPAGAGTVSCVVASTVAGTYQGAFVSNGHGGWSTPVTLTFDGPTG